MIKISAARRYAKAVYEMGEELNLSSKFSQDIKLLKELCEKVDGFVSFLANPVIDVLAKKEIISEALKGESPHPYIANLIFFLVEVNKIKLLPYICKFYQDIEDMYAGRVRGTVIVPEFLTDDDVIAIKSAIEKAINKEIILSQEVNKDMIGGIIVRVGDMVYDASVRKQLEILKDNIFKG